MEHTEDLDLAVAYAIHNRIVVPAEHGTTATASYTLVHVRVLADELRYAVKFGNELVSQRGLHVVEPAARDANILGGGGSEVNRECYRRSASSRLRTSSQGSQTTLPSSISSMRRSSSAS